MVARTPLITVASLSLAACALVKTHPALRLTPMQRITSLACAAILLVAGIGKLQSAGEQVYVIAESVSTSMEAHRIINQRRWIEVRLRRAQFVLVVVRSELEMPLTGVYE
jgi:hypothetical protein